MYMLSIVDVVGDVDDVAEDECNIMIQMVFVLQVKPVSALRPSQTDLRPRQDHTYDPQMCLSGRHVQPSLPLTANLRLTGPQTRLSARCHDPFRILAAAVLLSLGSPS